jgi:hypothetical protein
MKKKLEEIFGEIGKGGVRVKETMTESSLGRSRLQEISRAQRTVP